MIKSVTNKIDNLLSEKQSIIIGIDGNSASGKSTLSAILCNIYDCNVFHMDDFFLRPEQRTIERLNEPGGNVDYERFHEEIIYNFQMKKPFKYNVYDCSKKRLDKIVSVPVKKINIIEGVYSMHPLFINIYDLKVFLKISRQKQIERIVQRNGEQMVQRFINEWIPLEDKYFHNLNIEEKCDIVIEY